MKGGKEGRERGKEGKDRRKKTADIMVEIQRMKKTEN